MFQWLQTECIKMQYKFCLLNLKNKGKNKGKKQGEDKGKNKCVVKIYACLRHKRVFFCWYGEIVTLGN